MKSPPLIITTTIALQGTSCIVQSFQIHSTSCCSYTHAQTQREAAARYYGDDNDDIFSQRQRQRQRTSMNDGLRYQDDDDNEDLTKQFMTQVSLDELEERTNVARPASSGDSLNKVPVKFVNFDSQNPYDFRTALVEKGMNLMDVADDLGVPVPRSCKSGLCGACTADVYDPTCPQSQRQANSDTRPGHQTIRLCSAGAVVPAGCTEMVIDCYRNCEDSDSGNVGKKKASMDAPRVADAEPVSSTPASRATQRFGEDWEKEFEPDWAKGSADDRTMRKPNLGVRERSTAGFSIPIDFYADDDETSKGTQITRVATKGLKIQQSRLQKKKRKLPLAGSAIEEELSGERYTWYLGNQPDVKTHDEYGIALKSVKKDWTYHDIDRLLGIVFKPDVSDGIAPWDEIW